MPQGPIDSASGIGNIKTPARGKIIILETNRIMNNLDVSATVDTDSWSAYIQLGFSFRAPPH
jgi:hypothetical protein